MKLLAMKLLVLLCVAGVLGGSAAAPVDNFAQPSSDYSGTIAFDHHLLVDQFGYRPADPKVAVIRNPQVGYDHEDHFTPGATYEVRRASDGGVVFTGQPVLWNHGQLEASSGDNGWWFDFSTLQTPGRYFVFDSDRKRRSATFLIDPQVYRKILNAAVRMYFYQRSGTAKKTPYVDACWTDSPSYMGKDQDTEAHDITDRYNPAKVRDLSGGWFDAGDTNKYTTFAVQPVHQLLMAYQQNHAAFGDDSNIPESGNGIPDVLDEVKWETDWLKKMQYPDGGAALKVGQLAYNLASPPSSDHSPRFYVPSCTSATIAIAGMFAHAAYVFRDFPTLAPEAADLKARALRAWSNYQNVPDKQTQCDTGIVHAGLADRPEAEQKGLAVMAAIYLHALTDDAAFGDYVKIHYRETKPYLDFGWTRYQPEQGEALLFYATLPQADAALRKTILDDKLADVTQGHRVYAFQPDDDLYRAFMHAEQYHWGSNNPRAAYGNTNMDVVRYFEMKDAQSYRTRALGILHYFHGVNPLAMVYLSNMHSYGATQSANEIFHTWYTRGSKWSNARFSPCGPAPGYVPGGPNAWAAQSDIPTYLAPPTGQPAQKSYLDWNVGWPQSSWAITEPAIYYQSGYVKLLSAFVD